MKVGDLVLCGFRGWRGTRLQPAEYPPTPGIILEIHGYKVLVRSCGETQLWDYNDLKPLSSIDHKHKQS